jgi:hypothetical protein
VASARRMVLKRCPLSRRASASSLGMTVNVHGTNKEAGSGMPDPASSSVSGCGELCR